VKRVIGLPGDRVGCCDTEGRIVRNGQPIDEPYVVNDAPFIAGSLDCTTRPRSARCFDEVEVARDSYFVLGDNRAHSSDSATFCRSIGALECARYVPADAVVGEVVTVLWPPTRAFAPLGAP
jgi:signal peptidase I